MTLFGKAMAEMVGTFVIIFVGGGSILLFERYPHSFHLFGIAVTFGAIITLMILVFGPVSGANFNPAVTLAFAIVKRSPPTQVLVYWISQCAGGLAAAGLLIALRRI